MALCIQITNESSPCVCVQLSAAAAYFGLDERQKDTYLGGYLMAAFFLVGAPAALVVRLLVHGSPGIVASVLC